MPASTHVIAGRCTATYDDGQPRVRRGDVVVCCKPDDTLLVHDADGYQPVAWLTRADRLAVEDGRVVAWKDEITLEVAVHERYGGGRYPVGAAGEPVADCPDCDEPMVRAGGSVACPDCDSSYGLPGGADLLEETCPNCDLPRIEVVRGRAFRVCLDPGCEPLDDAVAEAFDREWDCPDCGEDLRVIRRGTLLLGCDAYPDCDWSAAVPRGEVHGACDCGLPIVEADGARACLDDACEQPAARPGTP